LIGPG